ncbi:MAG: M56 family metallopeptidase [Peptococcaceae bacterium]
MLNHTYIIYSFAGAILGVLLVRSLIRLNLLQGASSKAGTYFLVMSLPFFVYVCYRYVLHKPCTAAGLYANPLLTAVCRGGYLFLGLLTPFLAAVVILAVGRSALFCWYTFRLMNKGQKYEKKLPADKIAVLCRQAKIKNPELIILPTPQIKAFVFGLHKEYLVLSRGLIEAVTGEELDFILAHEICHLRHKDHLTNLAVIFLRDLMFFNPFIHWLYAKYLLEKEKSVDRQVVLLFNKPAEYASLLLKIAGLAAAGTGSGRFWDRLNPYPRLTTGIAPLEERVTGILAPQESFKTGPGQTWLKGIITALVAMSLALIC